MSLWRASGPCETVASAVPGLVHLRAPGGVDVFLEDVPPRERAVTLPARLDGVRIESDAEPGAVVLLAREPPCRIVARGWRVHEPHPELFVAPLARFAPTPREARTIRWLLRLLRIPGVTRLIRLWHAWRTR